MSKRKTHKGIKTTGIIKADVVDDPTTEQYLRVLDILGIDEVEFRREPSKALENVPDLPTSKIHTVLKIIVTNYDDFDFKKIKADAQQQMFADCVAFFLRSRLSDYLKRKLSLMNITDARKWLNGQTDKNLRKLGYIELSQITTRQVTESYYQ